MSTRKAAAIPVSIFEYNSIAISVMVNDRLRTQTSRFGSINWKDSEHIGSIDLPTKDEYLRCSRGQDNYDRDQPVRTNISMYACAYSACLFYNAGQPETLWRDTLPALLDFL